MLLPLFQQLGFHRITAAGHRDKAQEYGTELISGYLDFSIGSPLVVDFADSG
ncbi:hypothetical protein [Streptomyces aureoversilis]|uniref:Uncharacterized protein n=1 Tax=Streptomyces aureoversilis TaxID=67277 RepID=A0ABW0A062_9ACTN